MFSIKKLGTKGLCTVAMLVAVTVVLSYASAYLRIGNAIKFSISFVSVYVAACAFGPVIGGTVGAVADFITYIINPTGVFLWQITLVEFLYGFLFGVAFYRRDTKTYGKKTFVIRVLLCAFLQFLTNILLKTYILMLVGYAPQPYSVALGVRVPGCVAMLLLQIVVIIVLEHFMTGFIRSIRSDSPQNK